MGDISLDLIERLRAKADATTFAAEAEAFRAKADELSARRQLRSRQSDPAPLSPEPGHGGDGLAHWRTPAWWLVQSAAFRNAEPASNQATG